MFIGDLRKGLVLHLTCDDRDVDNGVIRDRAAYDNPGTLKNTVNTSFIGRPGEAFEFLGDQPSSSNETNPGSVRVDRTSTLSPTSTWTISGWIYKYIYDQTNNGASLLWNNGDAGAAVEPRDTGVQVNMGGNYSQVEGGDIPADQWAHVCVTYDNGSLKLYIDATVVSSNTGVPEPSYNNSQIYIGRRNGHYTHTFNGRISDVRMYNRALSPTEVNQLYQLRSHGSRGMSRVPVAQDDLVGHYPFASEGATDQSGEGNHGSILTSPTYLPNGGHDGSGGYDFATDAIDAPNVGDELNATQEFTISYWINYNNFEDYNVAYGNSSEGFWTEPWRDSSAGVSIASTVGELETDHFLQSTDTWYLITYTLGGGYLRAYVDGREVGNMSVGSYTLNLPSNHYIGSYNNLTNYIKAMMDDVRIYNRALSDTEIKRLYRSERNIFGGSITRTRYDGNRVVVQHDQYGKWLLVQNYEHLGGEDPESEITPVSTFPQMPDGETTVSDVQGFSTSGELRHVDNISQYGINGVNAVRLEAETTNHDRKIHYFTENQNVIDAVVDNSADVGHSSLKDQITKYSDHSANLPDVTASNEMTGNADRIFGYEFPMYQSGSHHWAMSGNGSRWEVDDGGEGKAHTTIHRVWVRI